MKKLIAILLVAACMLAMVACGGSGSGNGVTDPNETPVTPSSTADAQKVLDALAELIRTSIPTQSKVSTVTGTADINLKSELTITMGELSGKEAALYVHEYETFNDLGAKEAKTLTVETQEYVENMGLRVNGGSWESNQPNFVRRLQPYRMSLDAEVIKSLRTNEDETIVSFVVPRENTGDVFTNFDEKTIASMISDVSVRIETDGSSVTAIEIVYNSKSVPNMSNPKVEIKAEYSYDLQSITLLK